MSVLSSLYTGVSGLTGNGEAIGVIGDNIANSNSIGFKASRPEFADIMSKNLKGVLGGNQVGRGTKMVAVTPLMTQGSLDATERSTDLAVSGDGFFILKGSDGMSFTRDGSFHFDREGFLITRDGQRVQGYEADAKARIVNKMSDIKFPTAVIPSKPTEQVDLQVNLDVRTPTAPKPFDIKDPFITSSYAGGVEVVDSNGARHLATFFFNKVADGQWDWHALVDGAEITGGKEGVWVEVAAGKLGFNKEGKLETEAVSKTGFNFVGALPNQQLKIDFGDAIITDKGKGINGSTAYASESDLLSWRQDGYGAGGVQNLSFNDKGIFTILYSNGEARDLGQIALAKFDNPEGLYKVGSNRLKEARDSGPSLVGRPGRAGRGTIFSKTLERSTVDLALEFVNLIQTQRSFQANAKTITTTDELMQEVINLKR